MKSTLIRKIIGVILLGAFSQFSMADNVSSATEIAGIVASMNHFASDADKAKLMVIAADDSLAGAVRTMATAVTNIAHAANAEGKAAMATLAANDQAPDRARALAGVIGNFNHMASADDKAKLTELFDL